MKSVILAFLLFGTIVHSECPTAEEDCAGYTACAEPPCCEWDVDTCVEITVDDDTTTDAPDSSDCDDDLNMRNWEVDYIGKSTQFRIYDPCSKKFIKIKMEDLTEYDKDTNKKTNNKETSFASTKDWEEDPRSTADAVKVVFESDSLAKSEAKFTLETVFARNEVTYTDAGQYGNETVTLEKNQFKFSTNISNFIDGDSGNYAVLCIGIMTNSPGEFGEADGDKYTDGSYEIQNEGTALCGTEGGEVDVTTSVGVNGGGNQIDLCYTFGACDAGDIYYDPLISILNSDDSSTISVFVVSVLSVMCVLFV